MNGFRKNRPWKERKMGCARPKPGDEVVQLFYRELNLKKLQKKLKLKKGEK